MQEAAGGSSITTRARKWGAGAPPPVRKVRQREPSPRRGRLSSHRGTARASARASEEAIRGGSPRPASPAAGPAQPARAPGARAPTCEIVGPLVQDALHAQSPAPRILLARRPRRWGRRAARTAAPGPGPGPGPSRAARRPRAPQPARAGTWRPSEAGATAAAWSSGPARRGRRHPRASLPRGGGEIVAAPASRSRSAPRLRPPRRALPPPRPPSAPRAPPVSVTPTSLSLPG